MDSAYRGKWKDFACAFGFVLGQGLALCALSLVDFGAVIGAPVSGFNAGRQAARPFLEDEEEAPEGESKTENTDSPDRQRREAAQEDADTLVKDAKEAYAVQDAYVRVEEGGPERREMEKAARKAAEEAEALRLLQNYNADVAYGLVDLKSGSGSDGA